jgi:hypothetical protein
MTLVLGAWLSGSFALPIPLCHREGEAPAEPLLLRPPNSHVMNHYLLSSTIFTISDREKSLIGGPHIPVPVVV